jgi:hypothetical protein
MVKVISVLCHAQDNARGAHSTFYAEAQDAGGDAYALAKRATAALDSLIFV